MSVPEALGSLALLSPPCRMGKAKADVAATAQDLRDVVAIELRRASGTSQSYSGHHVTLQPSCPSPCSVRSQAGGRGH